MKSKYLLLLGSGLLLVTSGAARAQLEAADAAENEPGGNQIEPEFGADGAIIVRGQRLPGQLDVEQAPILELNQEDILALGANSIGELIEAIGPQTGSSRGRGAGRPVFLVNGIRVGSFRELRSYPPEAVARVEVMPEEVAQRFGFSPDRRVVNIILQDKYSSREIEAEYEQPDRGGNSRNEQEFTLLTINDGARLNFNFEANDRSQLTESEREIIQTQGSVSGILSDPDPARFRSLLGDTRNLEASVNFAKAFAGSGSSVSVNGTYERSDNLSLSGLNSVLLTAADGTNVLRTFDAEDPLEARGSADTFSTAASYSRSIGPFQLTATADANLSESETLIDRRKDTQSLIDAALAGTLAIDAILPDLPDAGFDLSRRRSIESANKVTLRGRPLILPAGEVSTTIDLGLDWQRIESEDTRTLDETSLIRRRFESGLNIVVPLTSRREGFLAGLGDFTANASLGYEDLSDFGSLVDWSAGLNWSPWSNLDLQASYIRREVAPSLSNLGNPQIETLNVPVFDLVNGETVLAAVTSGGNPDLLAETQADWRFGANWELPFWSGTRFSAEYIRNRSSDVTGTFPALSAEIEAAFPGRVTRDGAGTLIALDRRAVTYDRTRTERLVFGLTTRGSWGAAAPSAGQGRRGPPPQERRARPQREPPNEEQRAQFMAFRERICAEDGMAFLEEIADAVERGDNLSEQFPEFDLSRAQRRLERFKDVDGKIDRERLEQFRERLCSMDPSQLRGGPAGGDRGEQQSRGRPPGGAQRRNPISSGFGRDGRGRYFVNLNHTIELENQISIAESGPLLDLLDGDAQSDFGQARHSTRLEMGFFHQGKGIRASGRYTGSARINGNIVTGSSPLFFGDIATFDLRVFANLGTISGAEGGFLKGLTVSFRANNVFDAQRRIVDINGDTPLRYQPLLLDPNGRYLGIEFRKLF